jgi:pyrroloquinoline-quinone synthase
MSELMNQEEFRAAMKEAMVGRQARAASFSLAWANGELTREDFARWAETTIITSVLLPNIWAISMPMRRTVRLMPDFLLQNMYEEELADIRHTDLLIRFAEACGTTRERVTDPANCSPVTRGLQACAMRPRCAVTGSWRPQRWSSVWKARCPTSIAANIRR